MYNPDAPQPSLLRALLAQAFIALPAAFIVQTAMHVPAVAVVTLTLGAVALYGGASYSRQNNNWLGVECFDTERYARYADPKLLEPAPNKDPT
ncbi:MAG: hypothetical protein M3Z14_06745 [Candidatus Eremiobacteraeota bacterium]|nr:hypothetical protein [Candidatus Eremiobacteraeota bacterium]